MCVAAHSYLFACYMFTQEKNPFNPLFVYYYYDYKIPKSIYLCVCVYMLFMKYDAKAFASRHIGRDRVAPHHFWPHF